MSRLGFLDLPAEVRIMVYEVLLPCHRGYVRLFDKLSLGRKVRPANIKINLLFTCRQIYAEGRPVLFKVNTFCIMPLTLQLVTNEAGEECVVEDKNNNWVIATPLELQKMVTRLETELPGPAAYDILQYVDMSRMFPGLQDLFMFIGPFHRDETVALTREWSTFTRRECKTFYTAFRKIMPQPARLISADSTWADATDSPPYESDWKAISRVYGAEEDWDEEFHSALSKRMARLIKLHKRMEQGVDRYIYKLFGGSGLPSNNLGWSPNESSDLDDDSDEEAHTLSEPSHAAVAVRLLHNKGFGSVRDNSRRLRWYTKLLEAEEKLGLPETTRKRKDNEADDESSWADD